MMKLELKSKKYPIALKKVQIKLQQPPPHELSEMLEKIHVPKVRGGRVWRAIGAPLLPPPALKRSILASNGRPPRTFGSACKKAFSKSSWGEGLEDYWGPLFAFASLGQVQSRLQQTPPTYFRKCFKKGPFQKFVGGG